MKPRTTKKAIEIQKEKNVLRTYMKQKKSRKKQTNLEIEKIFLFKNVSNGNVNILICPFRVKIVVWSLQRVVENHVWKLSDWY